VKLSEYLQKLGIPVGSAEDFPPGSVERAKLLSLRLHSEWSLAASTADSWRNQVQRVKKEEAHKLLGFKVFDDYLRAVIGENELWPGSVACNDTQQELASPGIHAAYRLIAGHVYGALGRFAYAAWDHVNATYFGGSLPETLILWDLTEYGHALGWCRSSADGPPVIKLHPNLVVSPSRPRGRQSSRWNVPLDLLGPCYAYDVLLHECVHAHVDYNLSGWERLTGPQRSKWTCHNNPLWVAECNRIAELLGAEPCYSMKRYHRVEGRVQYGCDGPDFERFPHTVAGREEFYRSRVLPFGQADDVVQSFTQRAAGKGAS
jgi:hypothetical protein